MAEGGGEDGTPASFVLPVHCPQEETHFLNTVLRLQPQSLNNRDANGVTPLMAACMSSHFTLASVLLTQPGVDPSIPDNNGRLPLHALVQTSLTTNDNNASAAAAAAAPGPAGAAASPAGAAPAAGASASMLNTIRLQRVSLLRDLLSVTKDVNAADSDGNTAVHLCSCDTVQEKDATRPSSLVSILCAAKCDIHAQNKAGLTALQTATASEDMTKVGQLLELGLSRYGCCFSV